MARPPVMRIGSVRPSNPRTRSVGRATSSLAIAEAGREGEVRFFGEVDASATNMRRVVGRIANLFDRLHFCYEAGPTGYGLYRLIRSLDRMPGGGTITDP